MVSKELFELMTHGLSGRDSGRLRNLRTALSAAFKLPVYSEQVTPQTVAWLLLTYFFCRTSTPKKVVQWIEDKDREWSKMPDKHNPIVRVAELLTDAKILSLIDSVVVDKTGGFFSVNIPGITLSIPTQNIPDDYKTKAPVRDTAIISGVFIRQLAPFANAVKHQIRQH